MDKAKWGRISEKAYSMGGFPYPFPDDIILPRRATAGSAGYDIFAPFDIELKPGESITVPTCVNIHLPDGYFLLIAPRSGLGVKYRLQLDNTVGIIDSDYINSANEGHIMVRITNGSLENKIITIPKGTAFVQGIIMRYFTVEDDSADEQRKGGFGSTG